MSRIVGDGQDESFAPICLLELKFSADTFTVAMVLLNLRKGHQDGKTILTDSMKEALQRDLSTNMKFKNEYERWVPCSATDTHESRINDFIGRAIQAFSLK